MLCAFSLGKTGKYTSSEEESVERDIDSINKFDQCDRIAQINFKIYVSLSEVKNC